ncbi:hypothetical protein Q9Q94_10245 [Uliginosibacterium sp. 31-16]|uniref:hypothetical protein n=1 Tax=Uliginosibacterium sp. 31-16 TaxID=3068315 RepID=UPI00273D434E|nr:hypothetical protein [Uliginosibacterium sp. 31-16]MDP5239915.1 hypothetical protein [Uliginosibacterium sp. 31-16]
MSITSNIGSPSALELNGIVRQPDQAGLPEHELLFQHFTDTDKVIMPFWHDEHGPFMCEFVLTANPEFVPMDETVGIKPICSLDLSAEDEEWLASCAESFYWGWSNWSEMELPICASFWVNTFNSAGSIRDFLADLMHPSSDVELTNVFIAPFEEGGEGVEEDGAITLAPHLHCIVSAPSRDSLIEARMQLALDHPEVCFSLSFFQPWRQA